MIACARSSWIRAREQSQTLARFGSIRFGSARLDRKWPQIATPVMDCATKWIACLFCVTYAVPRVCAPRVGAQKDSGALVVSVERGHVKGRALGLRFGVGRRAEEVKSGGGVSVSRVGSRLGSAFVTWIDSICTQIRPIRRACAEIFGPLGCVCVGFGLLRGEGAWLGELRGRVARSDARNAPIVSDDGFER